MIEIDSHTLWEALLFDKGLEDAVIGRFVGRAEAMGTPDTTPEATDVVRILLDQRAQNILWNTNIESVRGLEGELDRALVDALSQVPESLVEEVAGHVLEELPPENEDVAEWD